jgi:hypothetical protein
MLGADPTYYEILGVAPSAEADEIEAAYRAALMVAAPASVYRIYQAYATLIDPERRRRYDAQLRARELARRLAAHRLRVVPSSVASGRTASRRHPRLPERLRPSLIVGALVFCLAAIFGAAWLKTHHAVAMTLPVDGLETPAATAALPDSRSLAAREAAAFKDSCQRAIVGFTSSDGALVGTTDGHRYRIAWNSFARRQVAEWSTGDPLLVCPQDGRLVLESQAEDVQAVASAVAAKPAQLACRNARLIEATNDGRLLQTDDGYSYSVIPDDSMRMEAARFGTGDRVRICVYPTRRARYASIENTTTSNTVQGIESPKRRRRASVHCDSVKVAAVPEDGSTVTLSDGRTYDVPQPARLETSMWGRGDTAIHCWALAADGTIYRSISDSAHFSTLHLSQAKTQN